MTFLNLIKKLDEIDIFFRYESGTYWLTDGIETFGKIDLDHFDNPTLSDYVYETVCQLEVDLDEHEYIAYSDIRQTIEKAYNFFNKLKV